MKFSISGTKLEQVILKYLDSKNLIIRQTSPNNIHFLPSEDSEYSVIRFIKNGSICLITNELIDEIKNFFSINEGKSTKILMKYVENKLGVKIEDYRDFMPFYMFKVPSK